MGGNGEVGGVGLRVSAEQLCTVLFNKLPPLDERDLQSELESWLGPCDVQMAQVSSRSLAAGTVLFERHRIVLLATPLPLAPEVLSRTVGISPMPEEERAQLAAHRAALRLLYVGESENPLEQLSALYTLAGAMLNMGGLGIVNERGALALPADLAKRFLPKLIGGPTPIQLWVGAVIFNLDEIEGEDVRYLVRTFGMEQMNLPDLCLSVHDRLQVADAYHALINICLFMAEDALGQSIGEGDRISFETQTYLLVEPGDEIKRAAGSGRLLMALLI